MLFSLLPVTFNDSFAGALVYLASNVNMLYLHGTWIDVVRSAITHVIS
jgi:hypothetical protein